MLASSELEGSRVLFKTVDAPALRKIGGVSVRLWTARDIEKARKVLAGIKPGRKPKAK